VPVAPLLAEAENRARSLILRPEVGEHAPRMMAWASDAGTAVRAAERAAQIVALLEGDLSAASALTPLRRVADIALRILANAAAAVERGDVERAERAAGLLREMVSAGAKARAFLKRTPYMVSVLGGRMARAALHCLMVAAVCAARIAHQFLLLATGQATPENVLTGGTREGEGAVPAAAGGGGGSDLQALPRAGGARRPAAPLLRAA
jgi:hypothetical protein